MDPQCVKDGVSVNQGWSLRVGWSLDESKTQLWWWGGNIVETVSVLTVGEKMVLGEMEWETVGDGVPVSVAVSVGDGDGEAVRVDAVYVAAGVSEVGVCLDAAQWIDPTTFNIQQHPTSNNIQHPTTPNNIQQHPTTFNNIQQHPASRNSMCGVPMWCTHVVRPCGVSM